MKVTCPMIVLATCAVSRAISGVGVSIPILLFFLLGGVALHERLVGRTTFTARRHTPLCRLKTPSHQIAVVRISRWPKGWTLPLPSGSQGYRQATIATWLSRAGEHAHTLHERYFHNLQIPYLQLDELRTRLRSATQVLWLWLAIDPLTKIPPVLQLGPSTQNMAHLLIHSLRQSLAAFLSSALYE